MRIGIRELICILVVAAIVPTFYFLDYKKLDKKVADMRAENESKKAKLEQLHNSMKGNGINDLGPEIDHLSQTLSSFEAKIPAEREVEVVLKEVTELAMRHGLKTKSIRAEKPEPAPGCMAQPMKLILRGDFDGYYSFLLDMERLSRITQVPQMKLTKYTEGGDGQVEADFTLNIYHETAATVGTALTNAR